MTGEEGRQRSGHGVSPGCHAVRFAFLAAVAILCLCLGAGHGLAGSIRYRTVSLEGPGSVTRLRADIGVARFRDVLRINRIDLAHAMRADTVVVPDSGLDLPQLSPFPVRLAGCDSSGKLILVAIRVQAYGAYEGGRLLRWGPICSGGRSAPTKSGLFFANWKARHHVSSVDPRWSMPWTINIDLRVGTALHEYALPGRPVSHCCIRLLEDDARWLYGWVEARLPDAGVWPAPARGTPVIVFGEYDFESPPPWKSLPADPEATRLGAEEIESALARLRDDETRS